MVNLDHLKEAGLEHLQVFESVAQMLDDGKKLVKMEGNDVLRAGLDVHRRWQQPHLLAQRHC